MLIYALNKNKIVFIVFQLNSINNIFNNDKQYNQKYRK